MVYSIKITNKDGKFFIFQEAECKSATYSMSTKFLKQALPDEEAEKSIIINLGRDRTINFPFTLRKTETDASNGDNIKTIQEKFDYLNDVIITPGLTDLYTLDLVTSVFSKTGIKGISDSLVFNPSSDKPNTLSGSFSLSVGGGSQ